jgi:hypothetical protein
MLSQELKREDLAKQALDLGQISQETYNRLVPPIDPNVPTVELTSHIPSVKQVVDKVYPGMVPLVENVASGVSSALGLDDGSQHMAGLKEAKAESVLRNPALDVPVETPVQLTSDKPAPQAGQASQIASNPMGGLMGAFNQQKQAISKAAMAGAEQAEKEAAYQEKMFQESEKMRMDQEQIEQGRAAKLMDQEKLLEDKINSYNSKPANVAQVFANAGTGQKLLMGLSLFLGSAPNSSGQNTALKAMQASIDADLSKAKSEVGERQNAYKEMKNTFQDERQASAAARMAYLNNAQLKLNQIASQYKSPQILENAKLLNAKIDEEKEKTKMQFLAAAQTSPAFQSADQMTQSIMKFPKEQQKELLEAREVYDATKAAEAQFDEIYNPDNFRSRVGIVGANVPLLPTESKTNLETTHAQIESAIRATMKGQGTIQESEIVRLVKPFLPDSYDSDARLKIKADQLKTLLRTKNAGQINRLKNAGIMPQEKKFSEGAPVSTKGK